MARRKPKLGYVYLLHSKVESEMFKYGCTTLTPEKRCASVNHESKEFDFEVVASFKSFDIFYDEKKVKEEILNFGCGYLGEIFDIGCDDDLNCRSDVISRFLSIGGIIGKGVK